jgi:hypothetical protein
MYKTKRSIEEPKSERVCLKITQNVKNQGLRIAITLLEDQLSLFLGDSEPESPLRKFLCVINCLICGRDTLCLTEFMHTPKL